MRIGKILEPVACVNQAEIPLLKVRTETEGCRWVARTNDIYTNLLANTHVLSRETRLTYLDIHKVITSTSISSIKNSKINYYNNWINSEYTSVCSHSNTQIPANRFYPEKTCPNVFCSSLFLFDKHKFKFFFAGMVWSKRELPLSHNFYLIS